MKAVHIRNVPAATLAAIKRKAQKNHRSLQGELLVILEQAAHRSASVGEMPPFQLRTVRSGQTTTWSRAEIYSDAAR